MTEISTTQDPIWSDFKAYTRDASGNLITVKAYRQYAYSTISGAVNNAGTITVTTSTAHNIILIWDNSVTYGADVLVRHNKRIYKSLQGANLNKEPGSEAAYWELLPYWRNIDTTLTPENIVSISSVVGMTDINNVYTIQSTPTTTTFTITQATVQTYTSGGTIQGGLFLFKWIHDYDSSNQLISSTIKYNDN